MKKTSRIIIWVASLIGLIDSGYLAYAKLFHTEVYCTPGLGDCVSVNASKWSEVWGIPVALFGMATYVAIIGLLLFGKKIKFLAPYVTELIFGIGFVGFLYSLYLTYIELFVLHAICQWCVLSAIVVTIIFITALVQLVKQSRSK
jgi:uncharacterized membrane protein